MFAIFVTIALFVIVAINLYVIFRPVKYDGYIVIETNEDGKKIFALEIDKDPDELEKSDHILFRVVDSSTESFPQN